MCIRGAAMTKSTPPGWAPSEGEPPDFWFVVGAVLAVAGVIFIVLLACGIVRP